MDKKNYTNIKKEIERLFVSNIVRHLFVTCLLATNTSEKRLTLYRHIKTTEKRTIIQQYVDSYTLAVDGWAVTFGTARRGLDGLS